MRPSQSITVVYPPRQRSFIRRIFADLCMVPGLALVVVVSTLYASLGAPSLGGFQATGYAWIVPLFVCFLSLLRPRPRAGSLLLIWLPWLAVVLGNAVAAHTPAEIQRSVMFISPMIVGLAVSGCRASPRHVAAFMLACKILCVFLGLQVLLSFSGAIGTALLGGGFSGAGLVMTTALLGALFAVEGTVKGVRFPPWWVATAMIPLLLVTRMGIAVSIVVLPLTAAPMKWRRRLGLIGCGGVLTLGAFMVPTVQQKMFFSGHGELADLRWDNPDLRTNARSLMWEAMIAEVPKRPWLGHGPGADLAWLRMMDFGGMDHVHNDWIRILYDYGAVGLLAFLMSAAAQVYHLLRIAHHAVSVELRILAYAGATSFLVLFLFMVTDNIINYPNFFGNLQLTIIGLVYAACNSARFSPAKSPLPLNGDRHLGMGFAGVQAN